MKSYLSLGLAGWTWFTLVCFTFADEPQPQTPADEFRGLIAKYEQIQEGRKKARQAETYKERRKLEEALRSLPNDQEFAADFFRLMEKHPKDPGVIDAYLWLLAHWPFDPNFTKATQIIKDNQIESEQMARACRWLVDHESSASIPLLWQLVKKSPHREVLGLARYSLAHQLKLVSESPEAPLYPWKEPDAANTPAKKTSVFDLWNSYDGDRAKETAATAAKLLEEVVGSHGEIKLGTTTLKTMAASELDELRRLSVGKTAPEIDGKDLNGKRMKLTDFRGKLVLLIFWDSTTVNDFGPVRAVSRRFNEEPFVILGVNGDKDQKRIDEASELQEITWPSWSDGNLKGPIARGWNVKNRPMMYLIDENGEIRFKGAALEGFTFGLDYDGSSRQNYRLQEAIKDVLLNSP